MYKAINASENIKFASPAVGGLGWKFDNLFLFAIFYYVGTVAFEAPIRYILSMVGLENTLYLRDALLILCIAVAFFQGITNKRDGHWLIAASCYVLITYMFASIVMGRGLFHALFHFKVFLPLLFGMAIAPYVYRHKKLIFIFLAGMFAVSVVGVALDYFVGPLPWEGANFDTAFGSVATNRVWWVGGGQRRLAGFGRASYTVALMLGVTSVPLILLLKSFWLRGLIFIVAIVSIYATTSKGVALTYALFGILSIPFRSELLRIRFLSVGAIFLAFAAAIIPVISWLAGFKTSALRSAPRMLGSFADRMINTWPNAFNDFSHWYEPIFGFGLGGVGLVRALQGVGLPFNAVDNLPLYFFMTFGVFGIVAYFMLIRSAFVASRSKGPAALLQAGIWFLIFGYGATSHLIEDQFASITIGCALLLPFVIRRVVSNEEGQKAYL